MINKFLEQTLNHYNISGRKLAEASGVDKNHVSSIKRGASDCGSTTLMKLLEGLESLAPGSRLYFCLLLAGKNPDLIGDLNTSLLVESMDGKQVVYLLQAIAHHSSLVAIAESNSQTEKMAV